MESLQFSKSKSVSLSVVPNSLGPRRLQPTRLLCLWDFPGKDTGVGCRFLLQGIFPTQGLKPGLLQLQEDSLPSELGGKPINFSILIPFTLISYLF